MSPPPSAPAVQSRSADRQSLSQLGHARLTQTVIHGGNQDHDEGWINLSSKKPNRFWSLTASTTVLGTAKAKAKGLLVDATRLSRIVGPVQFSTAMRTGLSLAFVFFPPNEKVFQFQIPPDQKILQYLRDRQSLWDLLIT